MGPKRFPGLVLNPFSLGGLKSGAGAWRTRGFNERGAYEKL